MNGQGERRSISPNASSRPYIVADYTGTPRIQAGRFVNIPPNVDGWENYEKLSQAYLNRSSDPIGIVKWKSWIVGKSRHTIAFNRWITVLENAHSNFQATGQQTYTTTWPTICDTGNETMHVTFHEPYPRQLYVDGRIQRQQLKSDGLIIWSGKYQNTMFSRAFAFQKLFCPLPLQNLVPPNANLDNMPYDILLNSASWVWDQQQETIGQWQ
jgi:hypothetical protein